MTPRVAVTHSDEYNVDAYVAALEAAGIEPVLISPNSPRGLDGLDGLVLCGGTDLNPCLYGEPLHPEAEIPEDALDTLELATLHTALTRNLPLLAICRGMQLFNVAQGGTLQQHMSMWQAHRRYDTSKSSPVHAVEITPETRLAAIFGSGEIQVNSRHHQAVEKLGSGLTVSACAMDGVIEGLERRDRKFAIGVQWHPENQAATDVSQARLFAAFHNALLDGLH